MNRDGVIYAIRYRQDAKVCYVGQTRAKKPEARWRTYQTGKTAMSRALQMLGGVEEFEFTILENVSGDRINERERYWIAHFGTLHPNGLNRTTGGSSGNLS